MNFSSFNYDFIYLCYILRLLQIVCISTNMFLVFMESGELSYVQFLFFMTLCGMYLHHVGRRWAFNIDGRYDLRQLFRSENMTQRVQYAIASLSASVLSLVMWSVVRLENNHFRRFSFVCGMLSTFSAHGLLLTEIVEAIFIPEK